MMRRWLALVVMLVAVSPARADISEQAEAASQQVLQASELMREAKGARDRVRALTATIQAFESGLSAMREGLRRASIRETALSGELQARNSEISALLGTLQSMSRTDSPTIFLHPAGAKGTVRGGMLLADIGPALNDKVADLRLKVEELQMLRQLQAAAAEQLQDGLTQVQQARADLNKAMAARTDLPRRFVSDPVREALLISTADTLDGFASGLASFALDDAGAPQELTASEPLGALPLPVLGVVLRGPGEADLAGIRRPGVLMATRPGALVVAPTAATIRYAGDLLEFGKVVILEPKANHLLIFAGLTKTYGRAGEVIPEGSPIGIMGAVPRQQNTIASTGGDNSGTDLSETLYIEVRQDNLPVDPSTWFALGLNN